MFVIDWNILKKCVVLCGVFCYIVCWLVWMVNKCLVWLCCLVLVGECNFCDVCVVVDWLLDVVFCDMVFGWVDGECSLVVCVFCWLFVWFIMVFWEYVCVVVFFFLWLYKFFSGGGFWDLLGLVFIVLVDFWCGFGSVVFVCDWWLRISIWWFGFCCVLVFFWIWVLIGKIFCICCWCRNLLCVWCLCGCISCGWIVWFCCWLVDVWYSVGSIIVYVCGCLVWVVWWFGICVGLGVVWCVWLYCFCWLCCVFWKWWWVDVWCVWFSFVVLWVCFVSGIVCGNIFCVFCGVWVRIVGFYCCWSGGCWVLFWVFYCRCWWDFFWNGVGVFLLSLYWCGCWFWCGYCCCLWGFFLLLM